MNGNKIWLLAKLLDLFQVEHTDIETYFKVIELIERYDVLNQVREERNKNEKPVN